MEALNEVNTILKQIESKEEEISNLKKSLSSKIEQILAEKGKSFELDGVYYLIKSRYNEEAGAKLFYIAKSDRAFGSWLRKNKNEAPE